MAPLLREDFFKMCEKELLELEQEYNKYVCCFFLVLCAPRVVCSFLLVSRAVLCRREAAAVDKGIRDYVEQERPRVKAFVVKLKESKLQLEREMAELKRALANKTQELEAIKQDGAAAQALSALAQPITVE